MERHEIVEIRIGENIAPDDDEGVVAEEIFHLLDGAGAPHQLGFEEIVQAHAVLRAIAESFFDLIGVIVDVDCYVVDSERIQVAQNLRRDWLTGNRHKRLWNRPRQRIEPRAHPAREQHRLHALRRSGPASAPPMLRMGPPNVRALIISIIRTFPEGARNNILGSATIGPTELYRFLEREYEKGRQRELSAPAPRFAN